MTATPDPNAVEAARLRLAQELLDERPSPKVRAAVMRAAAEAAGHGAADRVVAARRPSARRWFEWGPIAAMAGVTTVALLAVGVAIHVERITPTEPQLQTEQPSAVRDAVPASSSSHAAAAAPQSPATAAPPPTFDAMRNAPASGGAPASLSRRVAPAPPAARTRAPAEEPSSSEQAKPAEAPTPRLPAMQAPAMGTAAPQAAQPMAPPAAEARSSNARQSARLKAAKESVQPSLAPDDWLRRIIDLRRAGRNAEADDELGRFRAAYPNATIPPEALK